MYAGGIWATIFVILLRVAFAAYRASEEREAAQFRTWDQRPDPARRARRLGVGVDVAVKQLPENGTATSASVRARWAFGAGPVFALQRGDHRIVGGESGNVRSFLGASDRYVVTSQGARVLRKVLSPAVVRALDELPKSAFVRASETEVEVVVHDRRLDEAAIDAASRLVALIASFGLDVFRARVGEIEGAKVIEAEAKVPAHAHLPTRAGEANLDFDLRPDGLTATLLLETAATSTHGAELDAEGSIVSRAPGWLDHVPPHARRGIGPAKVTIEDGWIELSWNGVPTADQLARALELVAILATGMGAAYR